MKNFFLLFVPFLLWAFSFIGFFTQHLQVQADSISYAHQIHFYTDQLSRGVFPLWNPNWYGGAPNDFFLRRIGDVNPLLFLLVAFKWLGIPFLTGYLIFLAAYFFLAAWALYLITLRLLGDRFFAFVAYTLFLFSSWGSEIFYNYIIIIYVPIIWFFYFLLDFARKARKGPWLGACLCAGMILTTYIPFFFLTILVIFVCLYALLYAKQSVSFLKHANSFIRGNRIFTGFCIVFLLLSCVPSMMFYKESRSGEFVLPNRHAGSDNPSAVAVSMESASGGDIISHGYFDRIFDDHANMDMGDIYIPYVFFLLLLTTFLAPVNKLIFFLLFNILALSLITVTSTGGIQHFLYDHVIIFKFIRQIYYFFWLAMLPMAILLSAAAFRSLLVAIDHSRKKTVWLVYIIVCHVFFIVFLSGHRGILGGAWAAVCISLVYFFIYFRFDRKISYPAGFCLILLAVFSQSWQVYDCLAKKLDIAEQQESRLGKVYENPNLTTREMYYASHWFMILVDDLAPQVLADYRSHPYILYDRVIPYKDSKEFFKVLENSLAAHANDAFVSAFETRPEDWKNSRASGVLADLDPESSGEISVLHSDPNTKVLKAHLAESRFLVVNDNYNSDWHALINGQKARVFRANVSFKGLWLPAGDSKVVLRFSNPQRYMFHMALIVLYAGVFLNLMAFYFFRKRERQ